MNGEPITINKTRNRVCNGGWTDGSYSIFLHPPFWSPVSGSSKMNFVPLFWFICPGSLKMNFVPLFSHQIPGFPIFQISALFPGMSKIQLDRWILYSAKNVIPQRCAWCISSAQNAFRILNNTHKINALDTLLRESCAITNHFRTGVMAMILVPFFEMSFLFFDPIRMVVFPGHW